MVRPLMTRKWNALRPYQRHRMEIQHTHCKLVGRFLWDCVKPTKRCLKKVFQNAKLTYEELETVLIETEGVLNSRPLTYVYKELSEPPLTHSQLVSGRRLLEQVHVTENIDENNVSVLGKRARYVELLLRHFKKCWKFEYLTSICEFKRCKTRDPVRTVQEGDIVYIYLKTGSMGRVERLKERWSCKYRHWINPSVLFIWSDLWRNRVL